MHNTDTKYGGGAALEDEDSAKVSLVSPLYI